MEYDNRSDTFTCARGKKLIFDKERIRNPDPSSAHTHRDEEAKSIL